MLRSASQPCRLEVQRRHMQETTRIESLTTLDCPEAPSPSAAERPKALHPGSAEEVYACEFLGGGAAGRHLCTASSDSLLLWDLETGAFLQRCTPPVAGKRATDAGSLPARQLHSTPWFDMP